MIRLLLVDDHRAFLEPLAFMLSREEGFEVIGLARSLAEAKTMLDGVDIALVDLHLGDDDGLDVVRALQGRDSLASALVLTAVNTPLHVAKAIEAGAAGVLHKSSSTSEIVAAIKRLATGQPIHSAQELMELWRQAGSAREDQVSAERAIERLTGRERQILQELANGLSTKEIGVRLGITFETVRTHLVNILTKLGVHSQTQALAFAVRHRVVQMSNAQGERLS